MWSGLVGITIIYCDEKVQSLKQSWLQITIENIFENNNFFSFSIHRNERVSKRLPLHSWLVPICSAYDELYFRCPYIYNYNIILIFDDREWRKTIDSMKETSGRSSISNTSSIFDNDLLSDGREAWHGVRGGDHVSPRSHWTWIVFWGRCDPTRLDMRSGGRFAEIAQTAQMGWTHGSH